MSLTFIDLDQTRSELLPLSYTRPIAEFRVGILKISEKWNTHIEGAVSYITATHLQNKYKSIAEQDNICINSALLPEQNIVDAVLQLEMGQTLMQGNTFLAARLAVLPDYEDAFWIKLESIQYENDITILQRPWDTFGKNGDQIKVDFDLITKGRVSEPVTDPHVVIYNSKNVFIEPGAKIKACVIDAEAGPVYIGKNVIVEAGTVMQGPIAICENSRINIGAKLRGKTTIGPHSKVGGEVSNSVFFGYSNKGHEGYLGSSVIGEWCNLGADTNNSNLKNNYKEIKVWGYDKGEFVETGLQFCGLIMGDHSKCGINTMFNTGTVVGVGANIFGSGFPRNFIPSFSWGGALGFSTFNIEKSLETANAVMKRRSIDMDSNDEGILHHVYAASQSYRVWEKSDAK